MWLLECHGPEMLLPCCFECTVIACAMACSNMLRSHTLFTRYLIGVRGTMFKPHHFLGSPKPALREAARASAHGWLTGWRDQIAYVIRYVLIS